MKVTSSRHPQKALTAFKQQLEAEQLKNSACRAMAHFKTLCTYHAAAKINVDTAAVTALVAEIAQNFGIKLEHDWKLLVCPNTYNEVIQLVLWVDIGLHNTIYVKHNFHTHK